MKTKEKFALLQQAAKIIEVDGLAGINTATKLVGEETALSLLIAHLRVNFGSLKSYPADPIVDEKVLCVLRMHGLTN